MDIDAQLAEALHASRQLPVGALPAKVKKVEGLLADVETVEGLEVFGVRLCASEKSGSYIKPLKGSWVIIAPLQGKDSYYIAAHTEIGEAVFSVKKGLVLKSESESLMAILTDILAAVEQLTVTVPPSGGTSSVPVNMATFTQIKQRLKKLFVE